MALIGPARRRLRLVLESEQGMALPTALFALVAAFALASVAIISSLDAQHGTARDRDAKEAIAAADAGAGVALLRLNRFKANLSQNAPCIGPGGESVPESTKVEGWCPATPAESVGEATFTYRVSAFKKEKELSVVSVGTSGNVSRRIEVGLSSTEAPNVFATEQGIGQSEVRLNGGPDIEASLGTNGSITEVSENGQAATICGNIRYGVGGTGPTETDCENEITEEDKSLPTILAPEGIETNNSNCRLVPNCPNPENPTEIDLSQVDTYVGANGKETRTATNPWDAEAETINIGKNAVLTMGGQDYFVCGLNINNGQLIMAAGPEVQVRIFIRTPEECGLEPGALQVNAEGSSNIESTGFGVNEEYAVAEIYVLGESTVNLHGSAGTNELILYAPYSDVTISGNATWSGLVAGKTLTFEGHSKMIEFPGEGPVNPPLFSLWERTHYVECTGGSATPPNGSC